MPVSDQDCTMSIVYCIALSQRRGFTTCTTSIAHASQFAACNMRSQKSVAGPGALCLHVALHKRRAVSVFDCAPS